MTFLRSSKNFLPVFAFLLATALPALASDDWKPIAPEHLALKSPVVEKDADAEAIFWEVHVNDAGEDLILSHYIRIKISIPLK